VESVVDHSEPSIIVKELLRLTSKGLKEDGGTPGRLVVELFAMARVDTTGLSIMSPSPATAQYTSSTTHHEQRTTDSGNAGSGA
jgi:hypothetical protein